MYYPGLESHTYHDIARRQMRGFGGLVTFLVKDADWRATANIVDAVQIGPAAARPTNAVIDVATPVMVRTPLGTSSM